MLHPNAGVRPFYGVLFRLPGGVFSGQTRPSGMLRKGALSFTSSTVIVNSTKLSRPVLAPFSSWQENNLLTHRSKQKNNLKDALTCSIYLEY
jgi:hypothetical protein